MDGGQVNRGEGWAESVRTGPVGVDRRDSHLVPRHSPCRRDAVTAPGPARPVVRGRGRSDAFRTERAADRWQWRRWLRWGIRNDSAAREAAMRPFSRVRTLRSVLRMHWALTPRAGPAPMSRGEGVRGAQVPARRAVRRRPRCRACGVPGDPLTYYAATAAGGVWKSDRRRPHLEADLRRPADSLHRLASPSRRRDPNVVYVGTGEANIRGNVAAGNGIYKSTDAGKTWKHVWKQVGQIGTMVVHPTNADIAFAAVLGTPSAPTPSAASTAPPTAARRGSRCCSRTTTPARATCASTRTTRGSSSPACGRRGAGRGR